MSMCILSHECRNVVPHEEMHLNAYMSCMYVTVMQRSDKTICTLSPHSHSVLKGKGIYGFQLKVYTNFKG